MILLGFQIISTLFAVVMAYLAYTHYKRGDLGRKEVILWMLLWIGFIFVTLFPSSVNFLVNTFHFRRLLDLVMVVAFFTLFGLSFRNYIATERLEKMIEKLVRNEALKEVQGGSKDS